jgi:hypothetical protein
MPSAYINALMFALGLGIAAWVVGYRRMVKRPSYDRLRGMLCLPGVVLVLIALILLAFYWHWIVGGVLIGFLAYGAYKMIVR